MFSISLYKYIGLFCLFVRHAEVECGAHLFVDVCNVVES